MTYVAQHLTSLVNLTWGQILALTCYYQIAYIPTCVYGGYAMIPETIHDTRNDDTPGGSRGRPARPFREKSRRAKQQARGERPAAQQPGSAAPQTPLREPARATAAADPGSAGRAEASRARGG